MKNENKIETTYCWQGEYEIYLSSMKIETIMRIVYIIMRMI